MVVEPRYLVMQTMTPMNTTTPSQTAIPRPSDIDVKATPFGNKCAGVVFVVIDDV